MAGGQVNHSWSMDVVSPSYDRSIALCGIELALVGLPWKTLTQTPQKVYGLMPMQPVGYITLCSTDSTTTPASVSTASTGVAASAATATNTVTTFIVVASWKYERHFA